MPGRVRVTPAKKKVAEKPTRFSGKGKTLPELSQYVHFTPALKEQFLEQLREIPNVTRACRALGLTRRLVYNHRHDDPVFSAGWDEALEQGVESLEAVAAERAVTTSDILLMFLLKGYKPETYRERYDHTSGGAPIQVNPIQIVEVRLTSAPPKEELPAETPRT